MKKMYYVAGIIRTKEALSRCDQKNCRCPCLVTACDITRVACKIMCEVTWPASCVNDSRSHLSPQSGWPTGRVTEFIYTCRMSQKSDATNTWL